jgi:uncharacterized protein
MSGYHQGELEVQARAGVQTEATHMVRSIRAKLPPVAREFLRNQRMIIVSSVDTEGQVWASVLTGEPGFLAALDERTIEIRATPQPADPLAENIHSGGALGLLAINFATRQRMRVNGQVIGEQGSIVVHTEEVYSNCHQYIHIRSLLTGHGQIDPPHVTRTQQLSYEQQEWIVRADTFFIATAHSDGGADASHRGGLPGFVHVEDPTRLVFPDYSGNRMFQTLGNISANPHTGLLFLDFENGNMLQLTGNAQVIWEEERVAAFAGAERLVEFAVNTVIEMKGALPLRWQLLQYSSAFLDPI